MSQLARTSSARKTGLLIAAPSSGAGKTTLTLGLLRAFKRRGIAIAGAKSGPDYIDPRFHEAASGEICFNLDAWAMKPGRISDIINTYQSDTVLIEGAMGLFDGAPSPDFALDGKGASADLARQFGLPVLLVVDAARMSHSIAPLVAGFASHDPQVRIAGIVLNKVGSPRHEEMLRRALKPLGIPVLGAVPRSAEITHPDRHLGLVQASERPDLEHFLEQAADIIEAHLDLEAILAMAAPFARDQAASAPAALRPKPPAQKIAIARDEAFAFAYPHQLDAWRASGAELSFFSPLQDEAPEEADLIYLPGGYPELHAGKLAANTQFLSGLRRAGNAGVQIYGECGGYMVLGEGLIDKDGTRHTMAGLLQLETSFAQRKLHLGYRSLTSQDALWGGTWAAHEFHYASTLKAQGEMLFTAKDAMGSDLGAQGLRIGSVSGSFMHLIDRA